MALFGRKNANSDVPEDLQQYYNTGGSGIVTWVVRIIAGVVVLALLVWGGVWLGHKVSNKSNNGKSTSTSQTQQQQQANKAKEDAQKAEQKAQQEAADAAKKQEAADQKAAQAQQQQVASGSNGSNSSSSTSGSQTQSDNGSNLPNTGPGESLAAIFVGASMLGAAAHALIARSKRQLR